MNSEEAKKILALYRPGTVDRLDPDFSEALAQAKPKPPPTQWEDKSNLELAQWFTDHSASYLSIRAKFRRIPVPPGLKDRILAGQKPSNVSIISFRPAVLLRIAAVLALCLTVAVFLLRPHAREDDFNTYRDRMARVAQQPYGMPLQSHDLQSIHDFLAGRKAPAGYVLPDGIRKAQALGCAIVTWQGQPVSMLCFRSAQSPAPAGKPDLWLFVFDHSVPNGPDTQAPVMGKAVQLTTASWSQDGKTYVLAGAGDEGFLRKYL